MWEQLPAQTTEPGTLAHQCIWHLETTIVIEGQVQGWNHGCQNLKKPLQLYIYYISPLKKFKNSFQFFKPPCIYLHIISSKKKKIFWSATCQVQIVSIFHSCFLWVKCYGVVRQLKILLKLNATSHWHNIYELTSNLLHYISWPCHKTRH